MLIAVKGNREHKIEESEKTEFASNGYTVIEIEEDGTQKVLSDPNKQETNNEELNKLKEELEQMKKEMKKVKTENTKLKNKAEEETEN